MAGSRIQAAPSALTEFLDSHQPDRLEESSISHHYNLALQVLHNLQYQHRWTELQTHDKLSETSTLPRPLISGLPPTKLYIHPDEQVEIIKERARARKKSEANENSESDSKEEEVAPEPEWVLPTHIREEWSLEKFAQVFDAVESVPPGYDGTEVNMKWRSTKRLLLAIVQDDSTIVYYIIHDGIVKPRQN